MKENNEKFRKKIIDIEDEKTKLNEQLKATRIEKEQLLTNKDKTIEDLQVNVLFYVINQLWIFLYLLFLNLTTYYLIYFLILYIFFLIRRKN